MRHFYWKHKNLDLALKYARFGLDTGNLAIVHREEENKSFNNHLLSHIKAIHYNIASFSWSGWDEAGIEISDEQQELGYCAARRNLALARELNKGDLPLARAHWMLGAHLLAIREYPQAVRHFQRSEAFAGKAGSAGEQLLAQGYVLLAQQLETAIRVFDSDNP